MIVLVCGGRDFIDVKFLYRELDKIYAHRKFDKLIHGGAPGADTLAGHWARSRDIPRKEYQVDWKMYGKAAGPIRNQQMLDEGKPDLVIAFEGKVGTADMIAKAKRANVEIIELKRG